MRLPSDQRLAKVGNLRKLPVIQIRWKDSTSIGNWRSFTNARGSSDLVECESVGYLIQNAKDRLVLAQSRGSAGDCTDLIAIPRSAVVRVKYLHRGSQRAKS